MTLLLPMWRDAGVIIYPLLGQDTLMAKHSWQLHQHLVTSPCLEFNRACRIGSNCWNYYPGSLQFNRACHQTIIAGIIIIASSSCSHTCLMKSTGAHFYLMQLYGLNVANVGITSIVCQETRVLLCFFYTFYWICGTLVSTSLRTQSFHSINSFSVTRFLANMHNADLVLAPPWDRHQMCQRYKACYIKSSIITGLYWGVQCGEVT